VRALGLIAAKGEKLRACRGNNKDENFRFGILFIGNFLFRGRYKSEASSVDALGVSSFWGSCGPQNVAGGECPFLRERILSHWLLLLWLGGFCHGLDLLPQRRRFGDCRITLGM
jgi:hypothetical protein